MIAAQSRMMTTPISSPHRIERISLIFLSLGCGACPPRIAFRHDRNSTVGIADKTLNQAMYVSPKGLAITGGSAASEPTSPALRQQAATEGGVQQSSVPPSVP